jgi:viroplasmin and RNaseH domain-containing protein
MTWYVVHQEQQTRIFFTTVECHVHVNGFKGACYKDYRLKKKPMQYYTMVKKIEIRYLILIFDVCQ